MIALTADAMSGDRDRCLRLDAADAPGVRTQAHALKGALGTFAAKPACDAALTLETMGRDNQISGANRAYKLLATEIDRLQSALATIVGAGVIAPTP